MRSTRADNGERLTEAAALFRGEDHVLGVTAGDCNAVRSHAIDSGSGHNTDRAGLRSAGHRMRVITQSRGQDDKDLRESVGPGRSLPGLFFRGSCLHDREGLVH